MYHGDDAETGAAAAAGDDDADSKGPGTPSSSKECLALCAQCGLDGSVGASNCADFCTQVEDQAEDAECAELYADLVSCRAKTENACSLTACPNQTNAFSVCVLTFCDSRPFTKPLCTAW